MASTGFITNDAETANIQAVFTSILLHVDEAIDANSANCDMPTSCHWSHVDLSVDVTAGAVTEIEFFLTWDSAGDHLAWPVQSLSGDNLVAGIGDISLLGSAFRIDADVRIPAATTTAGKMYGWIRAAAGGGTMTVKHIRLYWTNPHLRA